MRSVYGLCSHLKSDSGLVSGRTHKMGSLYFFRVFFPVLLDDLQPFLFFQILRTRLSGDISPTVTFMAMSILKRFPSPFYGPTFYLCPESFTICR